MITKDEYLGWKTDNVTKAYMEACEIRMDDAKEVLVNQAGLDSEQDNFYRGFIHAYKEMLNFTIEDFE